jgi:hypothetical protein
VTFVADAHEPAFVELLDARLQMLGAQLGHVGLDVAEHVEAEVPCQVVTVANRDAEAAAVGEVGHGSLQLVRETSEAKRV